jgi:hypothetical protein
LNLEEKNSISEICEFFTDIFHLPGDNLTYTTKLEHEVKTSNPNPISTKIYRFPKIYQIEVKKQIDKMLKQEIIRPSIVLTIALSG